MDQLTILTPLFSFIISICIGLIAWFLKNLHNDINSFKLDTIKEIRVLHQQKPDIEKKLLLLESRANLGDERIKHSSESIAKSIDKLEITFAKFEKRFSTFEQIIVEHLKTNHNTTSNT